MVGLGDVEYYVESLRNKLNLATLCLNARDLLHSAFHGELDSLLSRFSDTSKSSRSSKSKIHVVFNLPELALDILCDEVRAIPHVSGIQEGEIHGDHGENQNRARDETNEMKNAKKVNDVNVHESNEAHDVRNMEWDMTGMGNTISSTRREGNLNVYYVYCYTFASSQSEVLEHLKLLLPHRPELHTAKIRHVRLVSPSKAMFCVEFDLELKGSLCACECGNITET